MSDLTDFKKDEQPKKRVIVRRDKIVKRTIKKEAKENMDKVIAELKGDVNTLEYANAFFKRTYTVDKYDRAVCKYKGMKRSSGGFSLGSNSYLFNCVFGNYELNKKQQKLTKKIFDTKYYNDYYNYKGIKLWTNKNGIEILGMKPERDKAGKYSKSYWGTNIKDLKQACKNNGIKGITKMDKCDLIKALIKC
jgi:hypothetical protein